MKSCDVFRFSWVEGREKDSSKISAKNPKGEGKIDKLADR